MEALYVAWLNTLFSNCFVIFIVIVLLGITGLKFSASRQSTQRSMFVKYLIMYGDKLLEMAHMYNFSTVRVWIHIDHGPWCLYIEHVDLLQLNVQEQRVAEKMSFSSISM